MQKGAKSIGIDIVAGRRANMTKPTRGFPPCHYCGGCGAGCDTASFFNSADHLIPFALKTGKLEIRSNAVAARVLVDDKGKARGVQYFDRKTGAEHEVLGKVVDRRRQLRRLDAHPAQLEVDGVSRTASATARTSSAATCASRSA